MSALIYSKGRVQTEKLTFVNYPYQWIPKVHPNPASQGAHVTTPYFRHISPHCLSSNSIFMISLVQTTGKHIHAEEYEYHRPSSCPPTTAHKYGISTSPPARPSSSLSNKQLTNKAHNKTSSPTKLDQATSQQRRIGSACSFTRDELRASSPAMHSILEESQFDRLHTSSRFFFCI